MLSFYNFSKMPFVHKLDYVNKNGNYVCYRNFLKYKIKLYHMDNFFAEIWIDPDNNVFNIFPFTSSRCLNPYLDLIDISEVVTNY